MPLVEVDQVPKVPVLVGGGSVLVSLIPVVCICDHSFSRFMTACISLFPSGEGCSPEEVGVDAQSVMNVEMTGCRYRAVVLPICRCMLTKAYILTTR